MINPFGKKIIYDEDDFQLFPFIVTDTIKLLKRKIETLVQDPYSDYILILGERGIGKTSTLIYLKRLIDFQYKKEENSNEIETVYFRSLKGLGSLHGIVNEIMKKASPHKTVYYHDTIKNLNDILRSKKYFFFIDVPDDTSQKELNLLSISLENLLAFKNINIIISMNHNHYIKMDQLTEILGKYMVWNLKPFTIDECTELIKERLKLWEGYKKINNNELYPFEKDVIEIIYQYSKGIPRNILSACDLLFQEFLENKIPITIKIAGMKLSKSYARKIIEDRAPAHLREALWELYTFISKSGKIEKESDLHNKVEEKFGWCPKTTWKRIRILEKFGLVKIEKDPANNWTNIIKVM